MKVDRQMGALQRRTGDLEAWKNELHSANSDERKEQVKAKIKICETDISNLKKHLKI